MFGSIFARISVIFLVILTGAFIRWRRSLDAQSTDALCRIALEVTLPALYFYTLATNLNRQLFTSLAWLALAAMALTFLSFSLGWIFASWLKLDQQQKRAFIFLATFANYGFLALPLIFALFGQEGLVRMFVFNLGIFFLYWTFGVAILTGYRDKGVILFKNLFNNAIIALLLGLVVGISGIKAPGFILDTANLLGSASIPLVLIVIGSILAQRNRQQNVSFKIIAALVFCRLVLIPGLTIACIKISGIDLPVVIRSVIILQAAMPSASTTPILAKRFGGDAQFAASGVFFTTLLSIASVPFWISLSLK